MAPQPHLADAAEAGAREHKCRLRLQGLLDHLELLRTAQEHRISHDNADAVTLTSMHGSKGLEWPFVFVVRMVEDECPLPCVSSAALEEERRLAYVACSRAKQNLFLSYITVDGSGEPAVPSRFLGELPPGLVQRSLHYGGA